MAPNDRSIEDLDKQIIHHLSESSPSTPKEISEHRFRENLIRVRCWQLLRKGLLEEVTHGLYELGEKGKEFSESNETLEEFGVEFPDPEINRITEFSDLDPEDIKWRNKQYLTNDDHRYDYGTYRNYRQVRRDISSVRNEKLSRVMREFPKREPLTQQCAHWVRAIVGFHYFPDANHRTAMASLNTLLSLNGLNRFRWDDDKYGETIFKSKLIRKYIIDVRFDNLWSRDELYILWHRYFLDRFYNIEDYNHHSPDYERLTDVLESL